MKNVKAWTASVKDFPEYVSYRTIISYCRLIFDITSVRFIDFGSLPCFIALSDLASTETRRKALREGYAQYVKLYTKDLELPGPYLRSRHTTDYDKNLDRGVFVGEYEAGLVTLKYPTSESNLIILVTGQHLTSFQIIPTNGILSAQASSRTMTPPSSRRSSFQAR